MTFYDEYCYNLMEAAIKSGAEGYGLSKEACVAYMNMMSGIRQAQQYIQERSQDFRKELAEGMTKGNAAHIEEYLNRRNVEEMKQRVESFLNSEPQEINESEEVEDGEEMGD